MPCTQEIEAAALAEELSELKKLSRGNTPRAADAAEAPGEGPAAAAEELQRRVEGLEAQLAEARAAVAAAEAAAQEQVEAAAAAAAAAAGGAARADDLEREAAALREQLAEAVSSGRASHDRAEVLQRELQQVRGLAG